MEKNTIKKDTSKRELNYHIDKIAWVIDPDAGPEDLLKFVLACFEETGDVWTVYEIMSLEKVKSTKNPFRYYYYLFILSVLAYQQLQKDNSKQSVTSKEPLVQFPIYAKDPVYGRLVKYYYGLKGKEKKGKARRYKAIPSKLRDGMRAMFEPKSEGKAAKKSKIKLIDAFTEESFHFWNVEGFPVDMFSGQTPKEVDIEKLNFPKTSVDIEVINDSIHQFRFSKRWHEWEKGREPKGIAKENPYFELIEDTLRMETPSEGLFKEPIWFRPSGPLAIDFQHRRVHINKEKVAALKEHVLNHQISMLESPAATGKTVLVRSLAFEPYEDKELEIFYFDCDSKRGFSPIELAGEIESTEGIFIIENIHLEPRKLSPLFSKLRNLTNRHILFTSRLPFMEREYLSTDELEEIHFFPQPELFEDADKIIDLYFSGVLEHPLPLKKRNRIKEVTSGNYKMLGYALEGCVEKQGKGEPEKWLEVGVDRELRLLEHVIEGPDGPSRVFPEIVLALSPLYMNEVLTEESFLRNELHFDKDDFKAFDILVELCEITSQRTRDGHVFYGLPHSVQAKAYWDYGVTYRNRRGLKEYEDFLYDYAFSGASNCLSAIIYNPHMREKIMPQLISEGKIDQIIKNENNSETITLCLLLWAYSHRYDNLMSDDILHNIAKRISYHIDNSKDVSFEIECITSITKINPVAGLKVVNIIDLDKLAKKVLNLGRNSVTNVVRILRYDDKVGWTFWKVLDVKRMILEIESWRDPLVIIIGLLDICEAHQGAGRDLWRSWNWKAFLRKLVTPEADDRVVASIFHDISNISRTLDLGLCEIIDFKSLAKKLNSMSDYYLERCLDWICRADGIAGDKLCELIDNKKVVARARKLAANCAPFVKRKILPLMSEQKSSAHLLE